jgi:NhaP-type Na+/H+ or K+/H+ antiporter
MSGGVLATVVAVSFLLLLANLILFLSKKIKVPFSVLLLLVGAVAYPFKDQFQFLQVLELNERPELLFFVFLPALLFESSFNIDFRRLKKDLSFITTLATLGVLISTLVVGILISSSLNLPIAVSLLFAAVIASTDPIAVISIFKELGVPKRLIQLVDSESMLNDGTSLILSKIIVSFLALGIVAGSVNDIAPLGNNLFGIAREFLYVGVTSIGLGVSVGYVTSKVIEKIKNEFLIEVSITLAISYLVFIIGEEINSSGIIAVVITGMILGNYGKSKFSPKVKHLLREIWEYLSFVANSLVFLMVGISFGLNILLDSWQQIVVSYLIVTLGRAAAVYSIGILHNSFNKENAVPFKWLHVLWWGGMRGALPIAVISFLLLENPEIAVTMQPFEEVVVANVIGVVFLSLIINGLTIRPLISLLKIDKLSSQDKTESLLMKSLVLNKAIKRVKHLEKLGEISGNGRMLNKKFLKEFRTTIKELKVALELDPICAKKALYSYTFSIERQVFSKLQEKKVISGKILGMLEDKIAHGLELIKKGIFVKEFKADFQMQKMSEKYKRKMSLQEFYMYRKAREFGNLEVLEQLESFENIPVLREYMSEIADNYRRFYQKNRKVCRNLELKNSEEVRVFEQDLYNCEFIATEEIILEELSMEGKISKNVMQDLHENLVKAGL